MATTAPTTLDDPSRPVDPAAPATTAHAPRWGLLAAAATRPWIVDAAVAVVLFGFALANTELNGGLRPVFGEDVRALELLDVVLLAAMTLPLALRRVHPVPAVAVVTVAFCLVRLLEVPEEFASSVALFIAIYTAGAEVRDPSRRRWVRGFGIGLPAMVLVWSLAQLDTATLPPGSGTSIVFLAVFSVVLNVAYFVAAGYGGGLARNRRERERQLEQRTVELAEERERGERQAVVAERLRIARELHDVVAHHVSVMGVQAGAARRVLDREPRMAKTALASVEESSREAVVELQRLLGFLRTPDAEDRGDGGSAVLVDVPQPTLERLDELLGELSSVGLSVEVEREDAATVPPGTSLTAYRIVQEALTNVLKHAGPGATAAVRLRARPDGLHVRVDDDGRGPALRDDARHDAGGTGNGIRGMRERTALHGGWLESGPRPGGGFRVSAWLPSRPDSGADSLRRTVGVDVVD